jgi:XTP/dITP diphosphohydrolase
VIFSEKKKKEIVNNDYENIEAEFGDVLFSLVNYARYIKINPENALSRTNKKFIKRFQYLENRSRMIKKSLSEMSLTEMNVLWDEAKDQ